MWIFMDIFKMRVLRWNVKTYSAYSFKMGTEYTKNHKNRFRNANLQRNFWLNWAQYKGSIGEKLVTLFIERLKIETWKLLHSIRNWKSCWIEYLIIKIGSKLPKTHTHFLHHSHFCTPHHSISPTAVSYGKLSLDKNHQIWTKKVCKTTNFWISDWMLQLLSLYLKSFQRYCHQKLVMWAL